MMNRTRLRGLRSFRIEEEEEKTGTWKRQGWKSSTKAKGEGRTTLTEAEAKQLLGQFGVPVVQEEVAVSAAKAAAAAGRMGFPVVLKGLGAKLTHKTERGLVRLNLDSRQQVLRAAKEIAEAAGADLEGFLVQPMLMGQREFVAGLIRDPQFGPVVMFGLGGVFHGGPPRRHVSASPPSANRRRATCWTS